MDEKRPATASERSDHKLKTELKSDDSGVPKAQTLTMEPERSATRIAKLGGRAGLKPLIGAWDQGSLAVDIKSDSSTIMISGTASPIGSRHSLENLEKFRKKGTTPQAERAQSSKHKLTKEAPTPLRGIDDLVAKLSDSAVQAQREAAAAAAAAAEEAEREADEEGMQRLAASKEKLQKFVQSNIQMKGAGVRSRDSADSSIHSLQSRSKGILVMGTTLMDTGEGPDLTPYVYLPGSSEEPVSSEQRYPRKQYGAQESDTQHQKHLVALGDQSKVGEGSGQDDKRQRQAREEEDSSKWKFTKREMDLGKVDRILSGKGDGQMGTRKGGGPMTDDQDAESAGLPPTAEAAKESKSKGSRGSKGSRRSGPKESDQGADDKKHGKRKAGGKKEPKAVTGKPQKPDAGEDKKREGRKKEAKSATPKPEDAEDHEIEPSSSDLKDEDKKKEEALPVAALQKRPSEPTQPEEKATSRAGFRRVSPRERKWKEFLKPEKPAPAPEPPAPPQPEEPPVVAAAPEVEPEIAPEEPGTEQPPEETDDEESPAEPPAEEPGKPVAAPERKESVKPSDVPSIKRPIQIYKDHYFDFTRPFVFSYFRTKPCHYNPANQVPLKPDKMDRSEARLLNQWRNDPDKFRDEGERRAALELLAMDERVKAMQTSHGHVKSRLDLLTRLPSLPSHA